MGQKTRGNECRSRSAVQVYFWEKEDFFEHNLSGSCTNVTHAYMQKSNGTFPVKALKAKERLHIALLCLCCLQDRCGRAGKGK